MTDTRDDMRGAEFHNVRMNEARFRIVDMRDARFDQVLLAGAVMRGTVLADATIDGQIDGLTINGVEVAPLVEAELDRRDPERVKMRPDDPDGYREAYAIVERRWAETVERARRLDPELLHESVDGEWSFIQTLRHLVFATDIWVLRIILGNPRPWHPLSLPFDDMPPHPEIPWDREARPPLDEVLALREDRMATTRRFIDGLTDEQLAGETEPVDGPGWPPARPFPVADCLRVVLSEEYNHRQYAERDLAVLEARGTNVVEGAGQPDS